MKKRETASQTKRRAIDKVLMAVGVREINGVIAETPEKLPERSEHGRNDRSGIVNALQNINTDYVNGI